MSRHLVRHGCGHYWLIARITWDDGLEISEGWVYDPWTFDKSLSSCH